MSDLRLQYSWEDPAGAKGAELRATWASLKISVGDEVLTESFDRRTQSERTQLFLPLYPLAEWIAEHWWHLLSEPLTPGRTAGTDYSRRHNLMFAGEGFATPSICIQPFGRTARLQWQELRYANSPIRFLSSGEALVDIGDLEQQLRGLIEGVIERLNLNGIRGTYLHDEWDAILSADREEASYCAAVAAMGLDPYGLSNVEADKIIDASDRLPAELADEFFSVASIDSISAQVMDMSAAIDEAATSAVGKELTRLRASLANAAPEYTLPWQAGFAAAKTLRDRLAPADPIDPSLGSLAELFGITLNQHGIRVKPDSRFFFEALGRVPEPEKIQFFFPKMHDQKARFSLCRLVSEYLTAGENSWRLVTQSRTDRQARNRAFAAEFLIPAEQLAQRLSGNLLDQEEVEDLALEFGVSSWVVTHQLENHGLARIVS